jgi:hypothetical protein
MKIEQSDISYFSSHEKHHEIKEQESLNTWNSDEDAPERLQRGDRLELSDKFRTFEHSKKLSISDEKIFDIPLDSKLMSIIRALEALTGKKINISLYRKGETPDLEALKQVEKNSEQERLG